MLGLGQRGQFNRAMLGGGLACLRFLHFAHQRLLRLGFGFQDQHLLLAIGFGDLTHFLDALFFLGHGLVDGDAFAGDVGHVHLALLDHLVALHALQLHFAVGGDLLQLACALDALGLDGHGTLAVLLGHFHFAQAVLVADLDQLLRFDAGILGQLALFFLHLGGLGLLARADGLDLALLAGFGFGLLALQRQQRFTRFHVLLGDGELFVLLQLVGHHVLRGGQLGNLADTLRVEDVELVQQRLRSLFQVVDRHVFQHVAVEIVADYRDDLVAEFLALLEQFGEVELLADGLQRFGELGVE